MSKPLNRSQVSARPIPRRAYFVLHWISRLLLIVGVVALSAIVLIYAQSYFYQVALKFQYERTSGSSNRSDIMGQRAHPPLTQTPKANSVTSSVVRPGGLILTALHLSIPQPQGASIRKIEIPSIGLAAMVLEGEDEETLRLAVGHISGTAVPGSSGNVGLAGHRDTFFRPLQRVRIGDVIWVSTDADTFQYRVTSTLVVRPEDVQVLDYTQRPTLTLVTCYPFHYIGAAPKRFIVRAEMIPSPIAR
jgi:LPXTG-site transpeptidase (sortase) family protein